MTSHSSTRAYFRKKLDALLSFADDEGFMQLLWAGNALQAEAEQAAAPYIRNYPPDAVTTDISSPYFMYKWEIETIANEILAIPKRGFDKKGRQRKLVINNFQNIASCVNFLRKLENAEAARGSTGKSIYREMARIANRQFDWQRGYFNLPQFYRNAYVYGQGKCSSYFEEMYGITTNQLSLIGFGLFSQLTNGPVFLKNTDMSVLGITPDILERAIDLLCRPIHEMRDLAKREREGIYHTAYRPSVFRKYPCISFGSSHQTIRSPLPQLILERVTSGIFHDVIGGGGDVRNDYGSRFESYCLKYLKAMLPNLEWLPEKHYIAKPYNFDTPDILLRQEGSITLAIECKATRMGHGAKFGDGSVDERGFQDIVKAVFQIWRFFSHCRRGLVSFKLSDQVVGAVLTLDDWLLMANSLQSDILSSAREMSLSKDPLIAEEDQKPICFFSITNMEQTLAKASEESFLTAVRTLCETKYHGWMLTSVHEQVEEAETQPARAYPFRQEMGRLLPWWEQIELERDKRQTK